MTEKKRNLNLDLARCTALLFVPCLHGLDHTGVYNSVLSGGSGIAMLLFKLLITSCIPMYLMLSGYLCSKKELNSRYYLGLIRILVIYFICSVATMAFEQLTGRVERSFTQMIGALLNFNCSDYSWYILMYFGLFLMIPFLNMAYNGLKTQREKQVLVLTFIALSVLPSLLNMFFQVVTNWWLYFYPLCYYFTGAYLREYTPEIKIGKLLACLAVFMGLYSVLFYFRYSASGAALNSVIYYDTWEVYIISVLLFVLLNKLSLAQQGFGARLLIKISELSLPAYLLTWISDSVIYPRLIAKVAEGVPRYKWLLLTVPVSLLAALIMAQLAMWLYTPVGNWVKSLSQKPFFNDSDPLGVVDERKETQS